MAGPIKRFVQKRKVRRRLDRLVRQDTSARKSIAQRAPVHADKARLAVHRANLANAQGRIKGGTRDYRNAALLAGTGMGNLAVPFIVRGAGRRAFGGVQKREALEGIATEETNVLRRRLSGESDTQRIRRRLLGRPKSRVR